MLCDLIIYTCTSGDGPVDELGVAVDVVSRGEEGVGNGDCI